MLVEGTEGKAQKLILQAKQVRSLLLFNVRSGVFLIVIRVAASLVVLTASLRFCFRL